MHQATPACTIEYRVDKPIVKCLDTYRKVIGKNGNPKKPLNNPTYLNRTIQEKMV